VLFRNSRLRRFCGSEWGVCTGCLKPAYATWCPAAI